MKKKNTIQNIFRSAKTGRFVTKKYADKHQKTTVSEKIKHKTK
jgi:hypothetical protein